MDAGGQLRLGPQLGRGRQQRGAHPRVLVQQVPLNHLRGATSQTKKEWLVGVQSWGCAAGGVHRTERVCTVGPKTQHARSCPSELAPHSRESQPATAAARARAPEPHVALRQRRAVRQHEQRHLALQTRTQVGAEGRSGHTGGLLAGRQPAGSSSILRWWWEG